MQRLINGLLFLWLDHLPRNVVCCLLNNEPMINRIFLVERQLGLQVTAGAVAGNAQLLSSIIIECMYVY